MPDLNANSLSQPAQPYRNGTALWKWICSLQATVIITGLTSFFMLGTDAVRRSEIEHIMHTQAPYIHDKQRIQDALSSLHAEELRLRDRVERLERTMRNKE